MSKGSSEVGMIITGVGQAQEIVTEMSQYNFVQDLDLKSDLDNAHKKLESFLQGIKYYLAPSQEILQFVEYFSYYKDYVDNGKNLKLYLEQVSSIRSTKEIIQADSKLRGLLDSYVMGVSIFWSSIPLVKNVDDATNSPEKASPKRKNTSHRQAQTTRKKTMEEKKSNVDSQPELTKEVNQLALVAEKYRSLVDEIIQQIKQCQTTSTEEGISDLNDPISRELQKIKKKNQQGMSGYYGDLLDGKKHGKGEYFYENGDFYKGEWSDDCKSGFGTYYFGASKNKYEGEWLRDKFNGKGVYTYSTGGKYDGTWREDLRHGKGVFFFSNGSKYEGEWKADKMHGKGIYVYGDGSKFVGEWRNGDIHGRGIYQVGDVQVEENWFKGEKKSEEIKLKKKN